MKLWMQAFQKTCAQDIYALVTSAARKWRKEVFQRKMSLEERKLFDLAKEKEIKNYVANDVLEKLEPHERPPRENMPRMRWILESRLNEDEKKSPKVFIVMLGYLDPDCEKRQAASPTMPRNTWQLLLQFGSSMGFSAGTRDVSGAFLRGRQLQRDFSVLPLPELAAAPNVARGEIMSLMKVYCGVVVAPVDWYFSISIVLEESGWRRLKSDPCCWILIDPDLITTGNTQVETARSEWAVVAATVFVGKEGNKVWEEARKGLQDHLRWKMWGSDNFTQCGVRIEHQKDWRFMLSQSEFVDELREIQIPSPRRKEKDRPVSPQEQTELRGLLAWLDM